MRLTKITTRTGDKGTTGLANGARLDKHHARIAALGSVDELNSHIGILLAEELPSDVRTSLLQIQNDLFDLGGALAQPGKASFPEGKIVRLDEQISGFNADLPALREFVLPGGSRAGAQCHVSRTVARRAERDLVALQSQEKVPEHALPYLNRLSDLLFVLARQINRAQKAAEVCWQPEKP